MADLQELLTAVRDTYQKVSEMFGLIKDHEQDLVVVEKAGTLMEDTKTNLLYLNDCIREYAVEAQHIDQSTDFMHNRISACPHTSPNGTKRNVFMRPAEKLLEDETKSWVEDTMRQTRMEMVELLEKKTSDCSTAQHPDCGMNSTQSSKHTLLVDESADFDIL